VVAETPLAQKEGEAMRNRIKQVVLDSYHIGCKDLLEFVRDRMMVISFVIMPIFMMVMIGFIFPEENILRGIPLGIVNQDDGD
jgi:hypothetical protein